MPRKRDSLATAGHSCQAAPTKRKKEPPQRPVVKRVVDEQSGFGVDVIFDSRTCLFSARIPGFPEDVLGREAGPVVERTLAILRATRQYQWRQSIVVDVGSEGNFWDRDTGDEALDRTSRQTGGCEIDVASANVRIRYYRIEIAPKPGDPAKFVCRPHADDVMARDAGLERWMRMDATERRAKGEDVGDFLERKRAVVLPYSAETWAAVQKAAADVLAVGERLRSLVQQPEALAALGGMLLASGEAAQLPAHPVDGQEDLDES